MTIFSSFSANFYPQYHTILALTVSMYQISSLICNKHDKLMAKMTNDILYKPQEQVI